MKHFFSFIVLIVLSTCSLFAQNEDILYTSTASRLKGSQKASARTAFDSENYTRVYASFAITSAESKYVKDTEDKDKGFRIGAIKGISLSSQFPAFFGIGGEFTFVTVANNISRESLLNFTLPLQLSARFGTSEFNVEPFAGIHGKFNALGLITIDNERYSYFNEDDMGAGNTFNRAQVGFQVGAGMNIHDIYIGYEFRKDISPMQTDSKMKTKTHFVSLGFNF